MNKYHVLCKERATGNLCLLSFKNRTQFDVYWGKMTMPARHVKLKVDLTPQEANEYCMAISAMNAVLTQVPASWCSPATH